MLSAVILSAIIEDVNHFPSASNLSSYFGIVPKVRISNNINKSNGITRAGSKVGRSTLIQAAWIAKRHNPYLGHFYERLKAKKGAKKAITATARKLLVILYYAMKKDIVYIDFSQNIYVHRHQT